MIWPHPEFCLLTIREAALRATRARAARRPSALFRCRARTADNDAPDALRLPRAPRPPARRARTLRKAERVVRNPSRTCLLERFAQAQQAATNPAFHGAERLADGGGNFAVRHAFKKCQLDGVPLRLGKGIHQRADFFRSARLIHRSLRIGLHHSGGPQIKIGGIFAAALFFTLQAKEIKSP